MHAFNPNPNPLTDFQFSWWVVNLLKSKNIHKTSGSVGAITLNTLDKVSTNLEESHAFEKI